MTHFCTECEEEVEVRLVDVGNFEPYGSTQVWREIIEEVCCNCGSVDSCEEL